MKSMFIFLSLLLTFSNAMAQFRSPPEHERIPVKKSKKLRKGLSHDPFTMRHHGTYLYELPDGRALVEWYNRGEIYDSKETYIKYCEEIKEDIRPGYKANRPLPPPHDTLTLAELEKLVEGIEPDEESRKYFMNIGFILPDGRFAIYTGYEGKIFESREIYWNWRQSTNEYDHAYETGPNGTGGCFYKESFVENMDSLAEAYIEKLGIENYGFKFSDFKRLNAVFNPKYKKEYMRNPDFMGLTAVIHRTVLNEYPEMEIRMGFWEGNDEYLQPILKNNDRRQYALTKYLMDQWEYYDEGRKFDFGKELKRLELWK
jgi:hypothetical protein